MKKLITSLIAVILLFTLSPLASSAATAKPIKVFYDGKQVKFDIDPIIENGTTLVEFRALFKALGFDLAGYNPSVKRVTGLKKGNTAITIVLTIGSKTATVNGKKKTLDVPSKIKNGRTLVPLKFVSQSTGSNVDWDATNRTITIDKSTLDEPIQVPTPKPPVEEPVVIPTLQLGQTYSDDKMDATLKNIVYTPDGFKVFLDVTNKSTSPMFRPGTLIFKLENPMYEMELNSQGYGLFFNSNGFIYQGETRTGYYEWYFGRDVKVKEIEYYANYSTILRTPTAIWKVN